MNLPIHGVIPALLTPLDRTIAGDRVLQGFQRYVESIVSRNLPHVLATETKNVGALVDRVVTLL